jgi:hypothetical protein
MLSRASCQSSVEARLPDLIRRLKPVDAHQEAKARDERKERLQSALEVVSASPGRGGRHKEPMGSPPEDRACAAGERALDMVAARRCFNSLVVEAFRARGLKVPRATVYAQPTNMRIKMAETGRFLAIVTASMLRFWPSPLEDLEGPDPRLLLVPLFGLSEFGVRGRVPSCAVQGSNPYALTN